MKEFGVVGLGRMGGGLAWQAMGKGYKVVGIDLHDPSADIVERADWHRQPGGAGLRGAPAHGPAQGQHAAAASRVAVWINSIIAASS